MRKWASVKLDFTDALSPCSLRRDACKACSCQSFSIHFVLLAACFPKGSLTDPNVLAGHLVMQTCHGDSSFILTGGVIPGSEEQKVRYYKSTFIPKCQTSQLGLTVNYGQAGRLPNQMP